MIVILLFAIFVGGSGIFAQGVDSPIIQESILPPRVLGDVVIRINLGLFLPAFFIFPDTSNVASSVMASNLTPGGLGELRLGIFLNDFISVGFGIGGIFLSETINKRQVYLIPITARFSLHPTIDHLEFPIMIETGMNITTIDQSTKADFIARLGVGGYYNIDVSWGLGLLAFYWFVPQIYDGTLAPASHSGIGNFFTISLAVNYHIP